MRKEKATPGPKIGKTIQDSTPYWPKPIQAAPGTPNVVYVVFDDVGFSDFGAYGSEIATPHLDGLAAGGLRYTNFHTTGLCSATRACLLTGRNHHRVGIGTLTDWDLGYPGSRGRLVPDAATLAELLRPEGWNTCAVGKWHLTPMQETTAAGPFDQWPVQRGFDRFYGFFAGETNHWFPELTEDNHRIEPELPPDYHLSVDLVDRAISYFRDQKSVAPEKPLFLNLAFGACHAPHQAPKEFIDPYREVFAVGYDQIREDRLARQLEMGIVPAGTKLTPRHASVKPWSSLSTERKESFVHFQAAYAGMLEHADLQIGRFVDFLEKIGQLENTVMFVLSDNGASQEGTPIGTVNALRVANGVRDSVEQNLAAADEMGGPLLNNNYPLGWAMAGNTPLKRFKQNVHGGGVRDPLIVHWPAGIESKGELRHDFVHATDLPMTVLDLAGVSPPSQISGETQISFDGVSVRATFADAAASVQRGPQIFELFGHRAIVHEGWKAVAWHAPGTDFEEDVWELYRLEEDFSEFEDLSKSEGEKLAALQSLWWEEARRNHVLPLDDRAFNERWILSGGDQTVRTRFEFWAGMSHLPTDAAPDIRNRSYTVEAEVELAEGVEHEGVLIAHGDRCSGWSLYMKSGYLIHDYNFAGTHTVIRSESKVNAGRHRLVYRLSRTGEHQGVAELRVDDVVVTEPVSVATIPLVISFEGLDVGRDALISVTEDYESPFEFTGKLERVIVTLDEDQGGVTPNSATAEQVRQ